MDQRTRDLLFLMETVIALATAIPLLLDVFDLITLPGSAHGPLFLVLACAITLLFWQTSKRVN
jgi:hypothetical protein